MEFSGIQKTSLLDFPDRISTVLFTPDCNLRCPYCHNWRIVLEPKPPFLNDKKVIQILERRKRYINAVAITGGEPTIHEKIPRFLKKLKEKGFAVKLDTNGFFTGVLKECLPFVDYVALDIKTSLEKYERLGSKTTDNLLRTVETLKNGETDYEFRTTVVPGFVDKEDVYKIAEIVKGGDRLAFQQFIPEDTLDEKYNKIEPYPPEVIYNFADIMKEYVNEVILRV
ncbi:MAG: anaerobic ribonucleoside-triphosphate reductase activating protein [Thermoproteota archaeon]